MSLILGNQAPDFTAPISKDKNITLSEFRKKKVVLYFYPKDDTPGCTLEGKMFKEAYEDFKNANTLIYGISADSIESHQKFREKYSLPFMLISDIDKKICALYDVIKLKNIYGKQVLGIERSTFLIDSAGILQNSWLKVKVNDHIPDVLQAAQVLK